MDFIKRLEVTRNELNNKADLEKFRKEQIEFNAFKKDFEAMTAFRDYLKETILSDKNNVYSDLEKYVKSNPSDTNPAITRTYSVSSDIAPGMMSFFNPKTYPIDVFEKTMIEFSEYQGFKLTVTNATQYNTINYSKFSITPGVHHPPEFKVSVRYEISFSS